MQSVNPLVSISCITYNHASFIKKALDGFLSQKTTFPFEILIHDDCSTDGTSDIIREYANRYPDVIFPMFEEENQYSQGRPIGTAVWNLPRARGKYIALCEGDDYWTDPLKLQKQVDFLESHPDYGMCYTQVDDYNQALQRVTLRWGGNAESLYELLKKNTVPTLTTVFRTSIYKEYISEIKPEERKWKMSDYPMWLYFALKSKIKFMNEVTGCYRVLTESACHTYSLNKSYTFTKNFYKIKEYFLSNCKIELSDAQKEELGRIKYFNLLPGARVLGDEEMLDEAKDFFKNHRMSLRETLILKYPTISRYILVKRYNRRGYKF